MIEGIDLDALVRIGGGPFRVTALVQKRLQELVRNGMRLPEGNQHLVLQQVFHEVENGSIVIELASSGSEDDEEEV